MPAWQAFLQVVKLEICLQAVLMHPIPEHQDVLQLAEEVIDTELWMYHKNHIKLDQGYFLQYVAQMSQLGKWKNFVLQALKDSCLKFYYSNSKKALKNTDEFQHAIPSNGLLLMAAVVHSTDKSTDKGVITGFHETGTDKVPDLSADKFRADFNSLWMLVNTLMENPDHCVELKEMLQQWAMIGMGDLYFGKGSVGGNDM
ncbi:hypothetical protein DFH29DRAFT_875310 [Suillus ampliporus]|nr:hypothetical protein DFH29DRAFT_875310 [Suillus ampliporus]